MSKKKKDRKELRREALNALFKSDYFISKIAVLMKMEDYPTKEVKKAFKKAMKRQAEESEISMSAWSGDKKASRDEDAWTTQSDVKLSSGDKRKVVKRDKNRETSDLISSILG